MVDTMEPMVYTMGPKVYTMEPMVYTMEPIVYTTEPMVHTMEPMMPHRLDPPYVHQLFLMFRPTGCAGNLGLGPGPRAQGPRPRAMAWAQGIRPEHVVNTYWHYIPEEQ